MSIDNLAIVFAPSFLRSQQRQAGRDGTGRAVLLCVAPLRCSLLSCVSISMFTSLCLCLCLCLSEIRLTILSSCSRTPNTVHNNT